ncbi:MAG: GDP-mannose 4,6-dehydratase [Anaerolineae bacterium]|nr:GDP-mannose 4,6-dehydratase [Anaerolineae bacterium]
MVTAVVDQSRRVDVAQALITGISGFVGSHLAEYLLTETDWTVAGTLYGDESNIDHIRSRLKLYPADLSQPDTVTAILDEVRPDYIFHLAAQPIPSLSRSDPWGTLKVNIQLQVNVLESVVRLGLNSRVLVVGSSEEYGLVRPEQLPVTEDTPLRPLNPYGVSKIAQDFLGLQYHLAYQVFVVRVRPFNHIGPRQRLGFVVPDFAQQVAEAETGVRPPVVYVGNLDVERDFSDVRDVVRAYRLALTAGEPGQVYNVGAGVAHSVREIVERLISFTGMDIEIRVDPERVRPAEVPKLVADISRLRERTGWEPLIPFEQSLRDVLDEWRARVRA